MENAETQIIKHTFQRKSRQTHEFSEMGIEVHKPVPISQRIQKPQTTCLKKCRRKIMKEVKMQKKKNEMNVGVNGDEEAEDDKAEVQQKIGALQRIVPGGESFGVEKLFEETAGYIVALQYQVKTMRALASFFEGLEKEKTKFGG
ncbi:Transcription factor like [Quillaja saponaria]|uniref:Transcription factor like n=1 Tax=Quillaja saponaria TaxID=32244 RepID=A0AAD7LM58_QUISA|nr:Transcription factor like [Quillaja saponaria]